MTKMQKASYVEGAFAGAVPVKDGYIMGDITGNIRKISIK